MNARIRRADALVPVPWRNGLGVTREIAVHPAGAGGDDFLWRVSVAEVVGPAPFSRFPGVDRSIVLLAGAGFTMSLDGTRRHALTTPFAPFDFPGEAQVEVALAGGPTRDFNLMLRRDRVRGAVQVWRGPVRREVTDGLTLLYLATGTARVVDGDLHAGDSWLPEPASRAGTVELHAGAVALAVHIAIESG